MAKITPDMIISDILKIDRGTAPILLSSGMHCLDCPSSTGESLADACMIHGIDTDALVTALNEYLAAK